MLRTPGHDQLDVADHHPARWWHAEGARFRCELCPRRCLLKPGQKAFCYIREATRDGIVLTTYGRSSGFCVDPIEKKPLNHFHPGTSVLSLGTAGCNLGCKYCQNWDISKARDFDRLSDRAMPVQIAEIASDLQAASVAFTYNDPIIFAEYAIDTAVECRQRGINTVAVTNGYICEGAREEFFAAMDAANIDLKGFRDEFYQKLCAGHLQPVLDTIAYAVNETDVWVELTTLIIPGWNDADAELDELTRWVHGTLGPDVPIHFTAFFPTYKLTDAPATPIQTLRRARDIAVSNGLHYVYTGNVDDRKGSTTWCPGCGVPLIERDGYAIADYRLSDSGACLSCGRTVPGHFDHSPGTWGNRRQPVRLAL